MAALGHAGGLPGTRLGIAAAVAAVVMVGGYGAELARGAVGDKPPGPSRPAVEYDPLLYPFTTASDSPVSEPGKVPHGELMRQAREQAAKQLIEHQARERVRRSQARVDARRASRTKYAGLSRDGAARLARQTFPTLITAPSAGALSSGRRADHYVDAFTASVRGAAPDGGDAVVVSSTPLRAKDAGGKLAPVDVTLEQVGDGWAAANPLEEYRIGPQADDGVDFPHLGLAIRPVENAADGDRAGKTVFFADSLTDTDTMVKPLTSGVQYAWQLRSKHAPERLSLDVDLPAGATLGQPGRDGVRVVEGGKTIARLGIATAFDADGEIVPTRLEVNGDRITIVIEHVGRDVAYPIAVDPDFVAGFYFSYSGYDAFSYWGSYNQSGKYTVFGGDFWWGRGLYILSHSYPQEPTPYLFTGGGPGTADRAGFYFNAPGNAHIWRAYSSVSRHILGASLAHCMIVGIAGPDLNYWEVPTGRPTARAAPRSPCTRGT